MLVLSRKKNEKIIIEQKDGTIITVVVVKISGNTVQLGIKAPKDISVNREKVHNAIQRSKIQ